MIHTHQIRQTRIRLTGNFILPKMQKKLQMHEGKNKFRNRKIHGLKFTSLVLTRAPEGLAKSPHTYFAPNSNHNISLQDKKKPFESIKLRRPGKHWHTKAADSQGRERGNSRPGHSRNWCLGASGTRTTHEYISKADNDGCHLYGWHRVNMKNSLRS